MKRPMPTWLHASAWRGGRVFVIRRIVAIIAVVALLAASIVSTDAAGRTLEAYRAQSSIVARQSQSDSSRNSSSDAGNEAGNNAENDANADAERTDSSDSSDESSPAESGKNNGKNNDESSTDGQTDTKASDIARTLADDAKAKPLSDAEKTAILERARATARAAADKAATATYSYTYCLQTKGDVGNATAFANIVFSTLNDPQGWPRAGVTFEQTSQDDCGSADMDIILAQARYMTDFSTMCSVQYSCRVGQQVIINDDRWNAAVDAWLDAGGTLSRYRHMVINHEVGHRLGHIDNETTCAGEGQRAPLMQEQSMHLDGCVPNEWPLDHELWVG